MGLEDVAHHKADRDTDGGSDKVDDNDTDADLTDGSRGDRSRTDDQRTDDHRDDDHLQQTGKDGAEHADPGGQSGNAACRKDDAGNRADDETDQDLVQNVEVQVRLKDTAFFRCLTHKETSSYYFRRCFYVPRRFSL